MVIEDQYLLKYFQENFNALEKDITKEFLDNIKQLNITKSINYTELLKLKNLEEIIISNVNVDLSFFQILSKLNKLEKLTFINSKIDFMYFDNNLKYLCINNCEINSIEEISKFNELDSLYLDEVSTINLDYFPNIKNITNLSFMNTKILNSNKLIILDKIENLCLTGTEVESIDTLIEIDTLKTLVIDEEIYNNNKEVVKHLISNNVNVVDYLNRNVVDIYE